MDCDGVDLGMTFTFPPFLESEITSIGCDRLAAIIDGYRKFAESPKSHWLVDNTHFISIEQIGEQKLIFSVRRSPDKQFWYGVGFGKIIFETLEVNAFIQWLQIAICQTPEGYLHTGYSDAYIKRNPQSFCVTCQRWQFKRRRCELFVEGKQE